MTISRDTIASPVSPVGSRIGRSPGRWFLPVAAGCLWIAGAEAVRAQTASWERPPIDYHSLQVDDAVTRLAGRLASGESRLEFDDRRGYLPALLRELGVPVSSQGLVFTKTSLQLHRISPERPRAVYFGDDVYVGWCQSGDVIEVAAHDARQGPTFYTLAQTPSGPPQFVRDKGQCLSCHASHRTQGVPGYLVRSIVPDPSGRQVSGTAAFTTDHRSPFSERWGGWYVTGLHGSMRHMGNTVCDGEPTGLDPESGANRTRLDPPLSLSAYLTPHSDLVALMVLEHQTQMHNSITAAGYETREALHQTAEMNRLLKREDGFQTGTTRRRIETAAERVVERMLFCGEFPLECPVDGTSGFAESFAESGPRDRIGRSLREPDLKSRLFRHPCSYLIYSDSFAALPDPVRSRILDRMRSVLSGEDRDPRFDHLSDEDRANVLAILRDTTPWF